MFLRWKLKQATRSYMDHAIGVVLQMVGMKRGQKVNPDQKKVIAIGLGMLFYYICIISIALCNILMDLNGIGQFSTNTVSGDSSLHRKFEQHLIRIARSMGILVVGVKEYNTTKKCPCCGSDNNKESMRHLFCKECNTYFHRDIAAAENIAMLHIHGFSRPTHLLSPAWDSQVAINTHSDIADSPDSQLSVSVL